MTALSTFGMRQRLLLAQSLVLVAGGVTTWVVASVVGPPLFREHLLAFELTSMLLLTAIVGAVVIGKKKGANDAR